MAKDVAAFCKTCPMSNFMSKLLKQAYDLLGIKGIRTTSYHLPTDDAMGRCNQTGKQMLHRFVSQSGAY